MLNDAEMEMADGMQVKHHKARCVIDTVRRKRPAASSSMISCLCDIDPFLSEYLGFMSVASRPWRFPSHICRKMHVSLSTVKLLLVVVVFCFILILIININRDVAKKIYC